MTADWAQLADELDLWRDLGRKAAFWWRDDDATAASPPLGDLLALGEEWDAPVAIAVIPADADETLADMLARTPGACVLQHGYAHRNHAEAGEKKIELGGNRPGDRVADELVDGRQRLADLFGRKFLPIMVAPWNRIDDNIATILPSLGYRGVSTFGPRKRPGIGGIVVVNTHIDVIDWAQSRGFCGEAAALTAAIGHLAAKRTGADDDEEPTGLLTHHLVHDAQCWAFLRQFLSVIASHPAAEWISAPQAFGVET